jgi:beta-glucosidase
MHLRFYRLITQINNHETTVEEATKTILDLMTDDEHLALLQGNWFLTQYLSDNKASAYPAAVVSRLGVPGLHVVDGSRQSFFTEYPSPLGRAASFNLRLEELIVSFDFLLLSSFCSLFTSNPCKNLARHITRRANVLYHREKP